MAMNSLAGSSLLLDRVEKVLTVSQLPQGVVLICGAQPTMPTPERGCCAIIAAAYAIPEPAVAASTPTHPRPLQTDALGFVIPAGVEPETLNHFDSFPSDHGAVFFGVAIAVGRNRPAGDLRRSHGRQSSISPGSTPAGRCHRLPCRIVAVEQNHRSWFYPMAFLLTYQVATLPDDVRLIGRGLFSAVLQHDPFGAS
jgi:hypothetical protein